MDKIISDIPIIKTFIKDDKYYCYDTYTNSLLNVSKEIYIEICKMKEIGLFEYRNLRDSHSAYIDVISLLEKGLFKFDFIKEIYHPDTKYVGQLIDRCISQLIIEVTNACNFKCRYCHQSEKAITECKMINEDIAYKSIDYLFEHSKDANEIAITFYGGEPLLNFGIIEKIVNYSNLKFESKPILYNMTSNASLIREEMISFFVENKFPLLISLDGDKIIQNRHRKYLSDGKGTFDDVWNNILKIRDNYPNYFDIYVSFNAVVMPNEDSEKVIDFFARNDIRKNKVTLTKADLTGIDYFSEIHIANKKVYSKDYLEEYKDILDCFMKKNRLPSKWHHSGPCVPGARRLFVNVDGDFYPCEKVDGAKGCLLGNLHSGIDLEKAVELLNIGRLTNEDCKKCWAMRFCSMCVKQCLDGDSISCEKKKSSCKLMKEQAFSFLIAYVDNSKIGGQMIL